MLVRMNRNSAQTLVNFPSSITCLQSLKIGFGSRTSLNYILSMKF